MVLGALEEGGGVLEDGFDGGILDAVIGEVDEARGLEGVEDLQGGCAFGGRGAGEEGGEVDELWIVSCGM